MMTIVTPPAVEPVSLVEAKAHLRVEIEDDDDLITSLIRAARELCESRLDRSFITTTWRMSGDDFPGRCLANLRTGWIPERILAGTYGTFAIPKARLISVESITYLDSAGDRQTLDPSAYTVVLGDGGTITPAYQTSWPTARNYPGSIEIEFTAGYGDTAEDVPSCIKSAMKLLVGVWYENREAGFVGAMFGEVPFGVAALLAIENWGQYP